MRVVWGIIGVIVGFLLIRYSSQLTENLGQISWAERYLRGGLAGTYSMYRLVGLLFVILSLLYMFGGLGFILSPLGNLFGGVR